MIFSKNKGQEKEPALGVQAELAAMRIELAILRYKLAPVRYELALQRIALRWPHIENGEKTKKDIKK